MCQNIVYGYLTVQYVVHFGEIERERWELETPLHVFFLFWFFPFLFFHWFYTRCRWLCLYLKRACLNIMLISVLHTSFRYLDWIYLLSLCLSILLLFSLNFIHFVNVLLFLSLSCAVFSFSIRFSIHRGSVRLFLFHVMRYSCLVKRRKKRCFTRNV